MTSSAARPALGRLPGARARCRAARAKRSPRLGLRRARASSIRSAPGSTGLRGGPERRVGDATLATGSLAGDGWGAQGGSGPVSDWAGTARGGAPISDTHCRAVAVLPRQVTLGVSCRSLGAEQRAHPRPWTHVLAAAERSAGSHGNDSRRRLPFVALQHYCTEPEFFSVQLATYPAPIVTRTRRRHQMQHLHPAHAHPPQHEN